MYHHILIPTDGSETSMRGVDHGLALARALGSQVTLLTVTEPLPSYSGLTPGVFGLGREVLDTYAEQQGRSARAILAAVLDRATAQGITADTVHVPDARPADAILDTARGCGADVIVMASHGRRGLGRVLLGSQAAEVVNRAPVPVLVVR